MPDKDNRSRPARRRHAKGRARTMAKTDRLTTACPVRVFVAVGLAASLITACIATEDQPAPVPTAVLSSREIERLHQNATEVGDSYWGSWPDSDIHERLTDEVVFWDPSNGDFAIEGKATIAPMLTAWVRFYSAAEPSVERVMLSADAAAYRFAAPSRMWPPWLTEPPEHPPVVFLDVFGLERTTVTRYDVWLEDDSLEMLGYGCFAVDGCPEANEIVDRYLSAWTSRDRVQIAALYAGDATFTDSLLGIDVVGSEAIANLADERFGQNQDVTFETVAVYAQTNDRHAPTDAAPKQGDVIGVAIHHRVIDRDGDEVVIESLTAFELGYRHSDFFEPHPGGLIVREEVFHDSATFAG